MFHYLYNELLAVEAVVVISTDWVGTVMKEQNVIMSHVSRLNDIHEKYSPPYLWK